MNGTFSGNAAFRKDGPGTLLFEGTNSNTGNIHLWGGVLNIQSLGNAAGFTFDSPSLGVGTLQIGSGSISTIALPFAFGVPGIIDTNGHDITINAAISGGHYMVKTGSGKLTLPFVGNVINAKTKISEGILNVTHDGYKTATQTVFSGSGTGTLQIGESFTVSTNKAFDIPIVFMADGTIDTQTFDMDATDVIAGLTTYTFNKVGSGTLTLSGANIYQGPTHVKEGTLKAGIATGNSGAFGVDSAVTVDTGATLDFSTFANEVASLDNSGTVKSSATITTSTFTQNPSGIITLDIPGSSIPPSGNVETSGMINLAGTLNVMNTGGFSPDPTTEVILFKSSGSGKQINGDFSTISIDPSLRKLHYDHVGNTIYLGASSSGCDGTWKHPADGNWDTSTNWVSCIPGISGVVTNQDTATFPDVAPANVTVTLANSGGSAFQTVTLFDLEFNSNSTSYLIQQYMNEGKIVLHSASSSSPKITVSKGTHTIDTPIVLEKDADFFLYSGTTLTLETNAKITSASGSEVWSLSEGSGSGTLTNRGQITPSSLVIQGNLVENDAIIHPSGALAISGLGNTSSTRVNNHMTLTAGSTFTLGNSAGDSTLVNDAGKTVNSIGAFTIGGSTGTATLTNSGMVSSASTMTINSGNITNESGGVISSNDTLTINGGTILNKSGGTLGSSSSDFVYKGSSLTSSDQLLAKDYTQDSSATITLNFPTNAASPVGKMTTSGQLNLAGTLTVTNTGAYAPPVGTHIILFENSPGDTKQMQGRFAHTNLPFTNATITYDHADNQVILGIGGCSAKWAPDASGNWGAMGEPPTNWNGCIPGVNGDQGDTATFPNVGTTSPILVTLANNAGSASQSVTLHDIIFDSKSNAYTIKQFNNNMGTITLTGGGTVKPKISVLSGDHTINAPISLGEEARFSLHEGSLTLESNATITSASKTLYLSEGSGTGTIYNYASIEPASLVIDGNTVENHNKISPTGTLTINGIAGGTAPATVKNHMTMTSGDAFVIGGISGGNTVFTNYGTATSSTSFTVDSGTVTNHNSMSAASGNTLKVAGGEVVNTSGATLGSPTADFTFVGGSVVNSGSVLTKNYMQSSPAVLQTNVSSTTQFGSVTASGAGSLGGSLLVSAEPNFNMTDGESIDILSASGGLNLSRFSNVSFQNFPPSVIPSIVYLDNAVQLDIRKTVPSHSTGTKIAVVFNSIYQHNHFINLKTLNIRNRMPSPEAPNVVAIGFSEDKLIAQNENFDIASLGAIGQPRREKQQQMTLEIQEVIPGSTTPLNVYGGPIATFGSAKTKGDQIGIGYASAGAVVGCDYILEDHADSQFRAGWGGIGEYRRIWSTAKENHGSITIDRIHLSLYGTLVPKALPNLAFDGIIGFAFNWDDITRNTGINLTSKAQGDTTEAIGDLFFGVEYTFSGKTYCALPENLSIIPLLNFQYIVDSIDEYREKGAGIYNLKVDSHTPQSFSSMLGSRFTYFSQNNQCSLLTQLDAGWRYEYLKQRLGITHTPFNVSTLGTIAKTVPPGRNSLFLALDLLATFNKGWQLEGYCSYQLNNLYYDAFFYLGFGRQF